MYIFFDMIERKLKFYITANIITLILYAVVLILSFLRLSIGFSIVVTVVLGIIIIIQLIPSMKLIFTLTHIRKLAKEDPQKCLAYLHTKSAEYKDLFNGTVSNSNYDPGRKRYKIIGRKISQLQEKSIDKIYALYIELETQLDSHLKKEQQPFL